MGVDNISPCLTTWIIRGMIINSVPCHVVLVELRHGLRDAHHRCCGILCLGTLEFEALCKGGGPSFGIQRREPGGLTFNRLV